MLGGRGVVGRETLRALTARGVDARGVGRRPAKVPGARWATADLLDAADAVAVLRGSDVAYLTVGLPYSARVWSEQWPTIVQKRDQSCNRKRHPPGVFRQRLRLRPCRWTDDRAYADQSVQPKGEVRATALESLAEAAARQHLSYTVARSADFYGPGATTSVFNTFALDRIAAAKRGTWLFDADQPHSLTYTPDIGNALAFIGCNPQAHDTVWHLPTAAARTGRQLVQSASGEADAPVKVMGRTSMRADALFSTAARETLEMAYQYTAPYIFDSKVLETEFGVSPTPLPVGISQSVPPLRGSAVHELR